MSCSNTNIRKPTVQSIQKLISESLYIMNFEEAFFPSSSRMVYFDAAGVPELSKRYKNNAKRT
jgi:hypothetical protein